MKLVNTQSKEKCPVCDTGLDISRLEDNPYECQVCSFSFHRKTPIYIDFPTKNKDEETWD